MCQSKNKKCRDPEGCQKKRVEFALSNAEALKQYGQSEYERLGEVFAAEGFGCLNFSGHARQRAYERAISEVYLRAVILEGDPIEYYENKYGTQKITLWGNVHVGYAKYRTLHIILKKRRNEEKWSVVTVYDPQTKAWQWNETYTERICFCREKL